MEGCTGFQLLTLSGDGRKRGKQPGDGQTAQGSNVRCGERKREAGASKEFRYILGEHAAILRCSWFYLAIVVSQGSLLAFSLGPHRPPDPS